MNLPTLRTGLALPHPEPIAAAALIPGGVIAELGNAEQRELLDDVAAGDRLLAFAHLEPASRDSKTMTTRAVRQGDSWAITGVKSPVQAGDSADLLLVTAALPDGGHGVFLSDPNQRSFRDARVREAFSLAVDRKALAEITMEGLGTPVTQIVTPNIFGYDTTLPELKPDVEKAKKLLADAGYPNGFKVVFNFSNDRLPGDRAVGTSIAQMLARIGVEAVANAQPGATLFPARSRGDYSMVMSGWGTLTGEAHYTLSSLAHSNDPARRFGAFNWRGYKNDAVDKALQDAAVELDEAKRKAFLVQAGNLFAKDYSLLPIASVSSAWAMQKDKVKLLRTRADEDTLAYDIAPAK